MVLGKRRLISELSGRADSTSIHASDSGGECGLRGSGIRRFRRGQRAPRLYPGRRELRQRPPTRWARFGSYTLKRVFADRAIVFGAQSERRGGADPVGTCLAVRNPPAAFINRPPNRADATTPAEQQIALAAATYDTFSVTLPVSEGLRVSVIVIFWLPLLRRTRPVKVCTPRSAAVNV